MWSCFLAILLVVSAVNADNPCNGNVVVVLDASASTWTPFNTQMFNDQNNLITNVFTSPFFDHFERVAIGSYNKYVQLTQFGIFRSASDVAAYVESIEQSADPVYLQNGLAEVYNHNYPAVSTGKITVIFFVSDIRLSEVDSSRTWAKDLQDQGVRVVLIGHSAGSDNTFNINRLQAITNDSSTVFNWDPTKSLPDDDYQQWFKDVIGCPTVSEVTTQKPTIQPVTFEPTSQPSASFTPCRRRIVFAIDDSATNKYYKNVIQFLNSIVLTDDQWNHVERLGIAWYSKKIDYKIPFDSKYKLEDIRAAIKRKPTVSGGALDLTSVFESLATDFQSNSDFDSVYYIVFVAQPLTQNAIDSAQSAAQELQQNGRLSLIGVGSDVDENLLFQLSFHETSWSDPNKDFELPDWRRFFYEDAFGCAPVSFNGLKGRASRHIKRTAINL
ncbi:hypothetical protein M3Y95_00359300 [Aphelenchoides besseyi]|nr:hypothetical protein M3Y95_00359300 [Aphelenchoides besseyi]